jgi:hypothetical protein
VRNVFDACKSITRASGRGLSPGNLGPVKWHQTDRRVPFGAQKTGFLSAPKQNILVKKAIKCEKMSSLRSLLLTKAFAQPPHVKVPYFFLSLYKNIDRGWEEMMLTLLYQAES